MTRHDGDISAPAPSFPPTPGKLQSLIERSPDQFRIRWRSRGMAAGGCFHMLWLTGWTVGCIFLAVQAIREPRAIFARP